MQAGVAGASCMMYEKACGLNGASFKS